MIDLFWFLDTVVGPLPPSLAKNSRFRTTGVEDHLVGGDSVYTGAARLSGRRVAQRCVRGPPAGELACTRALGGRDAGYGVVAAYFFGADR